MTEFDGKTVDPCEKIVCRFYDKNSDLMGYLAVDSTINGRSAGGLRMLPDVSEEEIIGLARAMTLKYGFLGADAGGAKAGVLIRENASPEERLQRLNSFAMAIKPFIRNNFYRPFPDMGTDVTDISSLLQFCGLKPLSRMRKWDSGLFTGMSVVTGLIKAFNYLGIEPRETTLAIEGLGKVGASVARNFAERGGKVVAVSTRFGAIHSPKGLHAERLMELRRKHGDRLVDFYGEAEKIEPSDLLELDVDALSPCARHGSINAGNAPSIKAKVVSPGANNPVTAEAEDILFKRDILCLPDFITNCGGALGLRLSLAGLGERAVEEFVFRHVGSGITRIVETSRKARVAPKTCASELALKRFCERKLKLDSRGTAYWADKAVRTLLSRGGVPRAAASSLANWYYRRLMEKG